MTRNAERMKKHYQNLHKSILDDENLPTPAKQPKISQFAISTSKEDKENRQSDRKILLCQQHSLCSC